MSATEFPLYNGEVILLFDPVRHRYFVNGEPIDSATGILGALNKPALIPWAVNTCVDFLSGKLKPGKVLDEIELKALLTEAKRAHNVKRDTAADIGTLTHAFCERYIKTGVIDLPVNEKARNGAVAFLEWVEAHHVEFLYSERKIYSRRYRYAGTLDAEGYVDGRLAIIDFKTGKAIYPEARFQTAAYEAARREESGESYTRWIIRLDKEDGSVDPKEFPKDMEKDFAAFLGAFEAYKRLKELKNGKGGSMISGNHKHHCPKCGEYLCPQVTHCRKPAHTPCPECAEKEQK